MKAVVQRVLRASVVVDGREVASIGRGLLTLLGLMKGDTEEQASRLMKKIVELRIFEDSAGKMNLSLLDTGGEHLVISQFTLAADTSSGRRPSFIAAERPELARGLYERAIEASRSLGIRTASGIFQADMKVELVNDGPVTIILDDT